MTEPTVARDTFPPLRIGLLGAARIAPNALLKPARAHPEWASVTAIAARDRSRAVAMAHTYAILRVHASYADLVNDPDIDAVYNPLPNSLHAPWTIAALRAGKHVLCEKPIASNAAEAEAMRQAAEESGAVLMEAFHYRYHPLTLKLLETLQQGTLGAICHIETTMCIPMFRFNDIRYRHDLAGGALMDVGCYTIHLLRTLAGSEPKVVSARAHLMRPQIDRAVRAEFQFPGGVSGSIHCSLWSRTLLSARVRVQGERGEMTALNPWLPHLFNRFTLSTDHGRTAETVRGDTTYTYQLRAFTRAVHLGETFPTDPADAIANMQTIDAVYRATGLRPRGA